METIVRLMLMAAALGAGCATAQEKLRFIAFGAHPDDCDIKFGGTAALLAKAGHAVKFVSLTNGDAGHQSMGGGALAKRRRAEAQEAGRRLGVVYDVMDNHDGELMPTLENRLAVIRKIREWNADVVLAPRPNDYHPDHRYTGVLLQDTAYMVVVPNVTPDTPPLKKNPLYLYFSDRFQKPEPFRPDISVIIDAAAGQKLDALDAHVSQMYEWLPWVDGQLAEVPADPVQRKTWLKQTRTARIAPEVRKNLEKWYGAAKAAAAQQVESFEIAEYGKQPSEAEIRRLFPVIQ